MTDTADVLNQACELAERLREYSERKHGEPLIDDAAEVINGLVHVIQEEKDRRYGMMYDARNLLERWRSCES